MEAAAFTENSHTADADLCTDLGRLDNVGALQSSAQSGVVGVEGGQARGQAGGPGKPHRLTGAHGHALRGLRGLSARPVQASQSQWPGAGRVRAHGPARHEEDRLLVTEGLALVLGLQSRVLPGDGVEHGVARSEGARLARRGEEALR